MHMRLLEPDHFSHTQSMVAKRCQAYIFRPKNKVSGFWSSVGFKIGAVLRFCFRPSFILASREIRDTFYTRGPNFPFNIQTMAAKRGLTNEANVHTPM